MLRKMIAAACLALLLGWFSPAMAQSNNILIVASCGTQGFQASLTNLGILTEDTTGKLCVNATVNATVGGFQPNGAYGTLTATAASSASTALPTGATVRITNLGASAIVSCTFATGAATGLVSNLTIPPLSSVSRVIGSFDHIACIDQTGSTGSNLVVLEGGSGLGNDSGGGGGSGGGTSNITQVGGVNVPTAGGLQSGALPVDASTSSQIHADLTGPVTACAAAPCLTTIGNVGFDPSSGASAPAQAFLALPATTTTQIIPLSGVKVTYVTLSKVWSGGTVNVTFKYGTGANCGTGTTTLEGPYPMTAQAGWVEGNGAGPAMIVPSAQALCVTTDASVGGGVKLIYQQK